MPRCACRQGALWSPLFPLSVYKTMLRKKELSDDFDEYIMVIKQIIKSGQQHALSCLAAPPPPLPLSFPLPPLQVLMRCRLNMSASSSVTSNAEKP